MSLCTLNINLRCECITWIKKGFWEKGGGEPSEKYGVMTNINHVHGLTE